MFKTQSSKLIEIEHLSAGYDGKQVLSDVNLTVYQDDYLGIIGPNGGGKTTLMRLILGLMKPTEGTIRYFRKVKDENGNTILDENGKAKVEETKEISMGYLPQYNQLDKQFPISVYEVVLAGLSKTKGLFSRYTQAQHQQVLVHLLLESAVDVGVRLIENHDIGLGYDGTGEEHSLKLTAAEGSDVSVFEFRQLHAFQGIEHLLVLCLGVS